MDRSLTPPLKPNIYEIKLEENGTAGFKPSFGLSLYDDEDAVQITKDLLPLPAKESNVLSDVSVPIHVSRSRYDKDISLFRFYEKIIIYLID